MAKPRTLIRLEWSIKSLLKDKVNFDILEGKTKNAKETACKLKKLDTFTNQEIADLVGLSLSEIEQLDC